MTATVTNAPVIIDPIDFSRQARGEVNPFEFIVNGNIYQVLTNSQVAPNARVSVYLSTNSGLTWTEQDAINAPSAPDTGIVSYLDPSDHNIYIGYIDNGSPSQYRMVEFNTTTNQYGTPSAASSNTTSTEFFFCRRTNGDGVVFRVNISSNLVYNICSGGVWAGDVVIVSTPGKSVEAGLYDPASGAFHLVLVQESATIQYIHLASDFSTSGVVNLHETFYGVGGRPTLALYGTNSIAVGYAPLSGADWVVVEIGTPRSAPVFTRYGVFVAPNINEADSYVTLKVDSQGVLNVFWIRVNLLVDPFVDELDQSTFNGATWSTNTTYYDEITNPPANGLTQPDQFLHTLDAVQLSDGSWVVATALETLDSGVQRCTGFALVPGCPPETANPASLISVVQPNPPGSCISWTPTTPRASAVFYDMPLEKQGS